jgi:hypothetical protein
VPRRLRLLPRRGEFPQPGRQTANRPKLNENTLSSCPFRIGNQLYRASRCPTKTSGRSTNSPTDSTVDGEVGRGIQQERFGRSRRALHGRCSSGVQVTVHGTFRGREPIKPQCGWFPFGCVLTLWVLQPRLWKRQIKLSTMLTKLYPFADCY